MPEHSRSAATAHLNGQVPLPVEPAFSGRLHTKPTFYMDSHMLLKGQICEPALLQPTRHRRLAVAASPEEASNMTSLQPPCCHSSSSPLPQAELEPTEGPRSNHVPLGAAPETCQDAFDCYTPVPVAPEVISAADRVHQAAVLHQANSEHLTCTCSHLAVSVITADPTISTASLTAQPSSIFGSPQATSSESGSQPAPDMGESSDVRLRIPPAPDAQEALSLEAQPQVGSEHKEAVNLALPVDTPPPTQRDASCHRPRDSTWPEPVGPQGFTGQIVPFGCPSDLPSGTTPAPFTHSTAGEPCLSAPPLQVLTGQKEKAFGGSDPDKALYEDTAGRPLQSPDAAVHILTGSNVKRVVLPDLANSQPTGVIEEELERPRPATQESSCGVGEETAESSSARTPFEAHLGRLQQGADGDSPCVALHSASPLDAYEDR